MGRVAITKPALVVVLLLTGCQGTAAQKVVGPAPKQIAVGPQVGSVAPNIEGEDMNGQRLALADHKGQVVMLNFWANW